MTNRANLKVALWLLTAAALPFSEEIIAQTNNKVEWMTPASVRAQASARTDEAKQSIADRRARQLVMAMTIEQKMQQLTGSTPTLLLELPDCYGARHVTGIASLGIPTFRISNGPVGVGQNDCVSRSVYDAVVAGKDRFYSAYTHPSSAKATALPSAMGVAASFDPSVAERMGEVIATEMNNLGLHVFEAPGVNMARLPVLGRNFEYYGEDPFLTGTMATAETRAVQSSGLIAMAKHFLANEQETNRQTIQENIDEQTLREIYLLPFEMAVKDARIGSLMCAYNYVNGVHSCENRAMLTGLLRDEWGFKGYVQTDFFAMKSTSPTLNAGLDHEMPLPTYWSTTRLKAALAAGEIKTSDIDTALERRFSQMFRAGIFDRKLIQSPIDFRANGAKAREIGVRSAVLLQNNGALPIAAASKELVLLGKSSQVYAQQAIAGGAILGKPMGAGGGSSDVVPAYTVVPVEGIRNALRGADGGGARLKVVLVDDANQTATIDGVATTFAAALSDLAAADAIVVMAGTNAEEGADRATFTKEDGRELATSAAAGSTLDWYAAKPNVIATVDGNNNTAKSSGTLSMIKSVLEAKSTTDRPMPEKTVLVLKDNAGVAMDPSLVGPNGPAILEVWFPGQEDGNVVADLLFGKVNPSGKLPVTFPFAGKGFLDSITPAQFPGVPGADGRSQTVTYSEKLDVGYRWYDTNAGGACAEQADGNPCVAFPFGHGLSYTTFSMRDHAMAFDRRTGRYTATVTVTNTGRTAGGQVVQAYLTLPEGASALGNRQPPKRLVGIARVELAPGASKKASITIDPNASNHPLSVWSAKDRRWVTPTGRYELRVGASSATKNLVTAGSFIR